LYEKIQNFHSRTGLLGISQKIGYPLLLWTG
jgi:hypothetical protein